jgi:hypothetical protein
MKLKKTITFFQMSKDRSVNSLTDLFSDPHSKAFPIVNIRNNLLLLLLLLHCTIPASRNKLLLETHTTTTTTTTNPFTSKSTKRFFYNFPIQKSCEEEVEKRF